jgi:FMN phosphatase YigB (HAD superfamily)
VTPWVLLDCDGVLLDWETGLERHMRSHAPHMWDGDYKLAHAYDLMVRYGMSERDAQHVVHDFHTHADFEHLNPLPGAQLAVQELHKFCRLAVITACSTHDHTQAMRKRNLIHAFGDVFEHVHCTDTFDEKLNYLSQYEPGFWVEDHAHNAQLGVQAGHTSYLIDAPHNMHEQVPDVTRVLHLVQAAELILSQLRARLL